MSDTYYITATAGESLVDMIARAALMDEAAITGVIGIAWFIVLCSRLIWAHYEDKGCDCLVMLFGFAVYTVMLLSEGLK